MQRRKHLCVEAKVVKVEEPDAILFSELGETLVKDYRSKYVVYKGFPLTEGQSVELHITPKRQVYVDDLRLEQTPREQVLQILRDNGVDVDSD